jgi:cytochrome P450
MPLLGSAPAMRRDMLGFLEGLARDYGELAYFRLGPIRCVLVNRPEWIGRLLTKDNAHMRKPWDLRELSVALGQGLLTSEGELWKRQRHLIQPAFRNERIRSYAATMTERAQAMLDGWRDGQSLDVEEEMSRVTLDIAARTLFGTDVRRDADVIREGLGVVMDEFVASVMGWVPIPPSWPTPGNLRSRRAVRRIDEVIYRMVDARRAKAERGDDLLSWLLEAAEQGEGELTDKQLRDELITLLMAGHETTALALSWTLVLLAQNPEIERKLLDELQQVLGDRRPAAGDEASLPYTRQVVEEGMRLYPPAWAIGREASCDLDLDGHPIPKGTQIYFAQWVTHRDARFFPEPLRFDPDRWSPGRRKDIPRFAYFPFGGGPRVCIGMHFAMLEATLVLASIVQRYRVELDPEHPVELQPAITLRPKHGLRATVRARG